MFHRTKDVLQNIHIIIYNSSGMLQIRLIQMSYLAVEEYQKKIFLEINYFETATTQQA
jgi:hypothetical protein